MKKVKRSLSLEERVSKRIAAGEVVPVRVPRLGSAAEILKYQLCSELIRYKNSADLTQSELAAALGVNKSEISKIFSYQLGEFSTDRLIGMVEGLLRSGAAIDLAAVFDAAKIRIASFERKRSTTKKLSKASGEG